MTGMGEEVAPTEASGWPTNGPDFNRWNNDASGFVAVVQENPWFWPHDADLKYPNGVGVKVGTVCALGVVALFWMAAANMAPFTINLK